MPKKYLFTLLCNLLLMSCYVLAERPEFVLEIKDHLFYPSEIKIPPDQKIRLVILNYDQTPEQFDSFDLNREKVIFPGKKSVIYIGPLPQGRYHFFGEYHPNSAQGIVIVDQSAANTSLVGKK